MEEEISWLSGVSGVTLLFAFTILCITIILAIIFVKVPSEYGKTHRELFHRVEILKLATILIIIMGATYLAMYERLTEGVTAVFSGVAGYVLGTVKSGNNNENEEDI